MAVICDHGLQYRHQPWFYMYALCQSLIVWVTKYSSKNMAFIN